MSDTPFNQLSPGEAERLAMLAEEAGEIVQAVGKVLRHGYESRDIGSGRTNRQSLLRELQDLEAVRRMMFDAGDISTPEPGEMTRTMQRKLRYTHHQEGR